MSSAYFTSIMQVRQPLARLYIKRGACPDKKSEGYACPVNPIHVSHSTHLVRAWRCAWQLHGVTLAGGMVAGAWPARLGSFGRILWGGRGGGVGGHLMLSRRTACTCTCLSRKAWTYSQRFSRAPTTKPKNSTSKKFFKTQPGKILRNSTHKFPAGRHQPDRPMVTSTHPQRSRHAEELAHPNRTAPC